MSDCWTASAIESSLVPTSTSDLQVRAAEAQFALVERGEDRCRDGEQPERRDIEDGHPVELDPDAGRDIDRRDQGGGLGVDDDEEQQGVPQRDLEPGPVGREE